MSKKSVRLSEKAMRLAKQELQIPIDMNVTPDELITLLIMSNQGSVDRAQQVLDYMADEFAQKTGDRAKPRLTRQGQHYVEDGSVLGINRLLREIDARPTETSMSEVLDEVRALRQENSREHNKLTMTFSTYSLSIRTMLADLLRRVTGYTDSKRVTSEAQLNDMTKMVRKDMDTYALAQMRQHMTAEEQKRKGHYRD